VRVALVGSGAAAEYYHLPALLSELDPHSLWFVDVDVERAWELAARAGAPPSQAVREMPAVDAAIVALPSHLHADVTVRLLASGVHVLCEKPLATTAAAARRAVEAARRTGAVLAAGHFRRFFPTTPLVADLVRLCGGPRAFAAEEGYIFAWESRSDYWLDRVRAGGGVLADLGPHVLDLLRAWLGGELEVESYRDDSLGGVETDCALELRVPVPGTLELSRTRPLRNEIRIECKRGTITAPLPQPGELTLELDGRVHHLFCHDDDPYPAAFRAQLADFLRAARGEGPPAVPAEDGLAVVEAVEAAYGMRQPLPQPWVTELTTA
jgi:predicted dehydrogenase